MYRMLIRLQLLFYCFLQLKNLSGFAKNVGIPEIDRDTLQNFVNHRIIEIHMSNKLFA